MQNHQESANKISKLFKGIWTLEDIDDKESEIHEIVKRAIENPRNYVIKP